jgi:hypothetical protein
LTGKGFFADVTRSPELLEFIGAAIRTILQALFGITDHARDVNKTGITASAGAISHRGLSIIIRPIIQANPTWFGVAHAMLSVVHYSSLLKLWHLSNAFGLFSLPVSVVDLRRSQRATGVTTGNT